MSAAMTDREQLRQAILTLRQMAWRANATASELEGTYLAMYGSRGQRAVVRAELEALHVEAVLRAVADAEDVGGGVMR